MKTGKIIIFKIKDGGLFDKINKALLLYLLFISPFSLFSQRKKSGDIIYMEHADSTVFSNRCNPDMHMMKGNVVFRHENIFLRCDMAYLYKKKNFVEAYRNVIIELGDTLSIYGDHLVYEGNTNLVKMDGHVRIMMKNMTLFTNFLNYDRNLDLIYFFGGGTWIDTVNEMTSLYGQYSLKTKIAVFSQNITLKNPKFVLHSDTLKYIPIDRKVIIFGPSTLESDSIIIYSSKGLCNTITGESILYNRSVIVDKNNPKILVADTIFYSNKIGLGKALGHIELEDTIKKNILKGNKGYYNFYTNNAFITDSAKLIFNLKSDSFFLYADTFQMKTINNENEFKAFYGVCMYSNSFQSICDSLQFNTKDSILYFYKNPVFWYENYQINGEKMKVFFNETTIKQINIDNHVFVMEFGKNETYFNQIKGENLIAFFLKGELEKIMIEGNTESIYYFFEKNAVNFFGRNKTISPYITVFFKNRKLVKIECYPEFEAELLPILNLTFEQKFLKEFVDYSDLRPKIRENIFFEKKLK